MIASEAFGSSCVVFVGSGHVPDGVRMHRSSAGGDTRAWHARSPTEIDENCPSCTISGPSLKRQAPVASQSLPENLQSDVPR